MTLIHDLPDLGKEMKKTSVCFSARRREMLFKLFDSFQNGGSGFRGPTMPFAMIASVLSVLWGEGETESCYTHPRFLILMIGCLETLYALASI